MSYSFLLDKLIDALKCEIKQQCFTAHEYGPITADKMFIKWKHIKPAAYWITHLSRAVENFDIIPCIDGMCGSCYKKQFEQFCIHNVLDLPIPKINCSHTLKDMRYVAEFWQRVAVIDKKKTVSKELRDFLNEYKFSGEVFHIAIKKIMEILEHNIAKHNTISQQTIVYAVNTNKKYKYKITFTKVSLINKPT